MKVWIQGDSQVSQFLRKICSSRGMILSSPADCDLAVLNFPFSSISEELEKDFGKGQKIACGMVDEKINRISEEKNWILFQPLKDETYLLENAKLTAEGAVFFAMQKTSIALRDARCLVIGYGRIGKELTHHLRSFGADVTVAARRPERSRRKQFVDFWNAVCLRKNGLGSKYRTVPCFIRIWYVFDKKYRILD